MLDLHREVTSEERTGRAPCVVRSSPMDISALEMEESANVRCCGGVFAGRHITLDKQRRSEVIGSEGSLRISDGTLDPKQVLLRLRPDGMIDLTCLSREQSDTFVRIPKDRNLPLQLPQTIVVLGWTIILEEGKSIPEEVAIKEFMITNHLSDVHASLEAHLGRSINLVDIRHLSTTEFIKTLPASHQLLIDHLISNLQYLDVVRTVNAYVVNETGHTLLGELSWMGASMYCRGSAHLMNGMAPISQQIPIQFIQHDPLEPADTHRESGTSSKEPLEGLNAWSTTFKRFYERLRNPSVKIKGETAMLFPDVAQYSSDIKHVPGYYRVRMPNAMLQKEPLAWRVANKTTQDGVPMDFCVRLLNEAKESASIEDMRQVCCILDNRIGVYVIDGSIRPMVLWPVLHRICRVLNQRRPIVHVEGQHGWTCKAAGPGYDESEWPDIPFEDLDEEIERDENYPTGVSQNNAHMSQNSALMSHNPAYSSFACEAMINDISSQVHTLESLAARLKTIDAIVLEDEEAPEPDVKASLTCLWAGVDDELGGYAVDQDPDPMAPLRLDLKRSASILNPKMPDPKWGGTYLSIGEWLQRERVLKVTFPRECVDDTTREEALITIELICGDAGPEYGVRMGRRRESGDDTEDAAFLMMMPDRSMTLRPGDRFKAGEHEFECLRHLSGVAAQQGTRPTMEDAEVICHDLCLSQKHPTAFYGVYDGHGGRECAEYVGYNLHVAFQREVVERYGSLDCAVSPDRAIYESLHRAFRRTDNVFLTKAVSSGCSSGAAAVAVVLYGRTIWCSNCGDSRGVLSRGGVALELSEDQRPDNESEQARVSAAGGFVHNKRVNGRLAVSRSLGDPEFKCINAKLPSLVVGVPEIRRTVLQPQDEFMILACDGLFDVFTSQEIVDHVRDRLLRTPNGYQDPQIIVQQLVRDAIHCRNSKDNVSAVLVLFKQL